MSPPSASTLAALLILALGTVPLVAADPAPASRSVNALATDIFTVVARSNRAPNIVISPYSIGSAMAMASAGATGKTLQEMRRVLGHGDVVEEDLHRSFGALSETLRASAEATRAHVARSAEFGGPSEPVTLSVANRLFVENTRPVLPDFATFLLAHHGASPDPLDFLNAPDPSRKIINRWVADQTALRIQDLIPPGGITRDTALVIVNAVYFKAAWDHAFDKRSTAPGSFRLDDGSSVTVPMMTAALTVALHRDAERTVVGIPYVGRDFLFAILLHQGGDAKSPREDFDSLAAIGERGSTQIRLRMPKFKLQPPTLPLGFAFRELGMARAFDDPLGSADFSRISPRRPDDYLFISEVFHKTFIELDEEGTEAAAATAVAMPRATMMPVEPPLEIVVDRPFLFGILHRPTGLLLFAGRCGDPR